MSVTPNIPPEWLVRFFRWFCHPDFYEDIAGDLAEEYALFHRHHSKRRSDAWFFWQVLRLFRPSMMKRWHLVERYKTQIDMFRNYIKIGLRALWKFKGATAINVIGLSTGIASFVLIGLYVLDELSYDKHHTHAENIHRVTVKNYTADQTVSRQWAFASAGHASRLKEDYPEVTHAVRFYPWAFPDIIIGDSRFSGEQVVFADDDVFDVFSFPFLQGDPRYAFEDLYSIVLTEATAIRLFGNDWASKEVLGEQLQLQRGDQKATFKVTGVMKDMPDQQHFHFEYLAPIRFIEMLFGDETISNVGGNYNWPTYLRTVAGSDIQSLQEKMNNEFWDKYIGSFSNGEKARDYYDFELQPLLSIHLQSNLEGEFEVNGSLERVYIFGVIGILLLFVACVNYMNLATSHYSRRMKEVGVRKVIGAFRSTLVKQFLTESMLITVISFPLCVLLIHWALPFLNNFVDKQMTFNLFSEYYLILPVLALLITVGMLAGFYPALFLSRINLVNALKGEQSMNAGKWTFRSWLVTFQYAVTIALIFAIIVMESQMQFIRNSNPGYAREQVVNVDLPRGINSETFRTELLSHGNIEKASLSSRIPTGRLMDSWGSRVFKGDSAVGTGFRLPYVAVDRHFLDTYQIALAAGENFREGMETTLSRDSTTRGYYIVNEAAAKAMGYKSPDLAVNAKIGYGPTEGRIVGVMKDFHFESLHSEIVPMLLMVRNNYNQLSLKIRPGNVRETLDYIEETWRTFAPERTPSYGFVDELFEEQYQQERQWGIVLKVFAFIAILISCLGLIGLVGFIIETKLKEIGIRKVLGASTQSILMLVSSRFLVLAGVAFLIALPIAYYFMDQWLSNFVYRTSISVLLIVMPVVISVIITFMIISYQTLKAATMNPVECLKDE